VDANARQLVRQEEASGLTRNDPIASPVCFLLIALRFLATSRSGSLYQSAQRQIANLRHDVGSI
jgi:hypothetical protein